MFDKKLHVAINIPPNYPSRRSALCWLLCGSLCSWWGTSCISIIHLVKRSCTTGNLTVKEEFVYFCYFVLGLGLDFCHSFSNSFILVCIYLFVYVFISIFHEGIASVFAISCPVSITVSMFYYLFAWIWIMLYIFHNSNYNLALFNIIIVNN